MKSIFIVELASTCSEINYVEVKTAALLILRVSTL